MSLFIIDVESDGPIAPKYSMICFGAVKLTPELDVRFYGKTKPISELWNPNTLKISGFNREQHLNFDNPYDVMCDFRDWIKQNTIGRPIFISDNNGYDYAFINYYFHTFLGENPFGWSSRRIGDLYCGMMKDMFAKWKHFRKTKHNHDPINDCLANAEVLLKMKEMGLKINTK